MGRGMVGGGRKDDRLGQGRQDMTREADWLPCHLLPACASSLPAGIPSLSTSRLVFQDTRLPLLTARCCAACCLLVFLPWHVPLPLLPSPPSPTYLPHPHLSRGLITTSMVTRVFPILCIFQASCH